MVLIHLSQLQFQKTQNLPLPMGFSQRFFPGWVGRGTGNFFPSNQTEFYRNCDQETPKSSQIFDFPGEETQGRDKTQRERNQNGQNFEVK